MLVVLLILELIIPSNLIQFNNRHVLQANDYLQVPVDFNCVKTGPELRISRGVGFEMIDYVIAPLMLFPKTLNRARMGQNACQISEATVKDDTKYLVGYIILIFFLKKLVQMFFEVDHDAFEQKSSKDMNPGPRKVLYIDGVAPDSNLNGYPEYYFQRKYEGHPNASFITVKSFDDLIIQLQDMPQDSTFDRIEIFAHGDDPGQILWGSEKTQKRMDITDVRRLKQANLRITTPGAEIRFFTCSLATNYIWDNKGEQMLYALGQALLPLGGKVVGSPKNIIVFEPPADLRLMANIFGVANLIQVIQHKGSIMRDFRQIHHDVVQIEIPPPSQSCKNLKEELIKRF